MRDRAIITFYTRPGCHLCEEAKEQISLADCADRYTLHEINIDTDPALKARFGYDIPVIAVNGTVTFKHRVTAAQFKNALEEK